MSYWVGSIPHFADKQFERTFRIKWNMVDIIISNLEKYNNFWKKTIFRARKESIGLYVKFPCAQKMICYGVSLNAFMDSYHMGETTCHRCISRLA